MNKSTIITLLLALVWVAGQAQIHYRIEGNIGMPDFTGKVEICDVMKAVVVDSMDVVNGFVVPKEDNLPEMAFCVFTAAPKFALAEEDYTSWITLQASDGTANYSFDTAGNWSSEAPPEEGKYYYVPASTVMKASGKSKTFKGDKLAVAGTAQISNSGGSSDPYNASDYAHVDDFYYDHYDDFFNYQDAEDYYDEHN